MMQPQHIFGSFSLEKLGVTKKYRQFFSRNFEDCIKIPKRRQKFRFAGSRGSFVMYFVSSGYQLFAQIWFAA